MDQESEEVANGAYNLANVILRQEGDLMKAEELARECLRIRILLDRFAKKNVGISCNLLADILRLQNKLGDETRELHERSIAISIRNDGLDGLNAAHGNHNIGMFYGELAKIAILIDSKRAQLLLAKSHFEEAFRIYTKLYGPTYSETLKTAYHLEKVSSELSRM
jgi:tetratricopeptide (TPR) repeat protein